MLSLKFKKPKIFMDKIDFTQLEEDDTNLESDIQPQLSEDEIKVLQSIADNIGTTLNSVSIGLIVLQLFLAFGLKYIWNIMNLL